MYSRIHINRKRVSSQTELLFKPNVKQGNEEHFGGFGDDFGDNDGEYAQNLRETQH